MPNGSPSPDSWPGTAALTRDAYAVDLRQFTTWCRVRSLDLFAVRRAGIESFARAGSPRPAGRADATVTRRLCIIAGFYRYAVEGELLEHSPAAHADEVYGRDGGLRAFLEERRLPYAVTVPAGQTVLPRPGWRHIARLVQRVASEEDWAELPAGPSQAGTRAWQWWVRRVPDPDSEVGHGAWARWIIARRRPWEPQERDYFFAWGPEETPVEELVRVPGARWRAQDAIKLAKSACGLADYEVRSYHGWYRHITLAMLAAAFLAVQDARAAREREPAATPPAQRGGGRQSQH